MDKEQRAVIDEAVRDRQLAQQREHIQNLERLEEKYGLDLDIYTDVYGPGSIDVTNDTARVLEAKWNYLLESLKTQPVTVIVRTRRDLKPGCYGFGAEAEYELQAEVILVKGQADIVGIRDEDEASLQITGAEVFRLEGHAFVQEPAQTLACSSDFSNDNIMNGSWAFRRVMDEESKIIDVEDIDELYERFEHICSGDTSGLAMRLYFVLDVLKRVELAE